MDLHLFLPLVAAGDPARHSASTAARLFDPPTLGASAAGLAFGVLLVWLYTSWLAQQRQPTASYPERLFGELCRAHRLSAAQRRLLEWVIAELHVLQPAMVFLDPNLLEAAVPRTAAPAVRKRLIDLQSRLFAIGERKTAAVAPRRD
ncbi:MAG: hypothetical protein WD872_09220 [Pirellulaceae bacterium]